MHMSKVQTRQYTNNKRNRGFFRLNLCHVNLMNYYQINFQLMQHHKYSLTEIENMLPWERDVYLALLRNFIEEENKKAEEEMAKQNKGR